MREREARGRKGEEAPLNLFLDPSLHAVHPINHPL
jgi:hypothetical protein